VWIAIVLGGFIAFCCFMNVYGERIFVSLYWWNEARKVRKEYDGIRKRQQALQQARLLKDLQKEQMGETGSGG
jgi:hypothetical protein